jgi:hypothetical protein
MNGGAGGKHGGQARCVVWRPRGTPLPGSLTNALTRPDFKVTECDNQYEAFASLCKAGEPGGQTVLLLVEPKTLPAMSDVGDAVDRYAPDTTLWVFETMPSPQIRAVTPEDRAAWDRRPPMEKVPEATARRAGPVLSSATKHIADDAVSSTKVKIPHPPRLKLAGEAVGPNNSGTVVRPLPKASPLAAPQEAPAQARPEVKGPSAEGPGIMPVPSGKPGNLLSDEELEMLLAPDPGKEHY